MAVIVGMMHSPWGLTRAFSVIDTPIIWGEAHLIRDESSELIIFPRGEIQGDVVQKLGILVGESVSISIPVQEVFFVPLEN